MQRSVSTTMLLKPSSTMERHSNTPRLMMLACAILCGLASGSNYVYSGYAPQLAASLRLNSTQANLVGLAGNLGMYMTGPLWGRLVDQRGPRIPLLAGSVLNLVGYGVLRLLIQHTIPLPSTPSIILPAAAMMCTGIGGSAGLSPSVNAAAKSFSDSTRASATGAVLAGFGLSAFAFSMLGQLFFHGGAAGLLLVLSLGTSLPMLLGSFVVRPIPQPTRRSSISARAAPTRASLDRSVSPRTSLDVDAVLHLSRSRSPAISSRNDEAAEPLIEHRPARMREASVPPARSLTPLELLSVVDFHLLFVILAILCGVGLEWINNVGAVTLALGRSGWAYDSRKIATYQAKQVAIISIMNCSGRIVGGVISDCCKSKFGLKRVWFLPIVGLMFLLSQLAAIATRSVSRLWLVSAGLGLSYGSLFNVVPMLVLEWFGMAHFSQNYGWTCVAPILGGNAFNLLFGRVYDGHSESRNHSDVATGNNSYTASSAVRQSLVRAGGIDSSAECLAGPACYVAALQASACGCAIALALGICVAVRREWLLKRPQIT